MAQAEGLGEGFDPFLPGGVGGILGGVVRGLPWSRQRDDDAELRAGLVPEGHHLLCLGADDGALGDAGEIALVGDEEADDIVAMLGAILVPMRALAGRGRGQVAMGRGDNGPEAASRNRRLDLCQRRAAVAVEEGDVDLLGIGKLLDRRPGNLSGGEKQRVAIGRALLSAPRLLLMDEPLAALDDERKAEILPYLERLRDEMNIPIVYVSHSVAEVARLADRVVVVSDGKVVSAGSAAEVLSHPSIEQAVDRRTTGAWLEGKVERFDPVHRLSTIALKSARLFVPDGEDWVGKPVRLHIPAREVMLATARPVGISALNVLAGHVISTSFGPDNLMDVLIDCGGDIIQSRITELSCETLKLAPGKPVYAIIKTVALDSR